MSPVPPPEGLAGRIEALGVAFDPGDFVRLGCYLTLLRRANERFNLTAVTDPKEMWLRHIFDSLTLLPYIMSSEAREVLDVGSGGGAPGLPLAIVTPHIRYVLLEATGKKARFLAETASTLGLANVTVLNDRAETIGRDREKHREHYDVVTARAVGRLAVMLELTVPLAKIGGHVLAIKGRRATAEIAEAKEALYRLHSHVVDTRRTATGTIVVIEKQRRTPKIYPRRPGEPKRVPLGGRTGAKPPWPGSSE